MLHALSDSLRVDFHPKKKINDFYFDAWLTVIIQFRDVKTIFFFIQFANVEWGRRADFAANLKFNLVSSQAIYKN